MWRELGGEKQRVGGSGDVALRGLLWGVLERGIRWPQRTGRLSIPSCDLTTPQGQAIVFTACLLLTASRNTDSTSPPISGCTLPVGNRAQCCGDAEAEGGELVGRPCVGGKGWGGKFLFTWFLISIFRITQWSSRLVASVPGGRLRLTLGRPASLPCNLGDPPQEAAAGPASPPHPWPSPSPSAAQHLSGGCHGPWQPAVSVLPRTAPAPELCLQPQHTLLATVSVPAVPACFLLSLWPGHLC